MVESMACNADFVQYIQDQCSATGEIAVKKMMGDYCIYCNGVLFGLICDNNLFIKETDAGRAVLKEEILRQPYPGARNYFFIDDVDDSDYLTAIIKATLPALQSPRTKSQGKVKKVRQIPTSLDDRIEPNLVCSQDLRPFFKEYLGNSFRYTVKFQQWLHDNPGKTYRDAIDAYRTLTRPKNDKTDELKKAFFKTMNAKKK